MTTSTLDFIPAVSIPGTPSPVEAGLGGASATRLTELLRERWSPRNFEPTHVISDDELLTLLQAAQWAPSAGNSQPWSFIVARRGDQAHGVLVDHVSRGNAGWVPQASAILMAIAQIGSGPEDDAPQFSEYAEYDLGQAVAHVTVQARSLGLETRQFAGFDHDGVAAVFNVPANYKVMVGIAIGVPQPLDPGARESARASRPRHRKDVSTFAFSDTWGRRWISGRPPRQDLAPHVI